MTKKTIWTILLLVLLLVACQSEEEPTPTPLPVAPEPTEEVPVAPESEVSEPITIRFAVFDFEQGRYDDLIEAFEEENPDIKIKLASIEEILELESIASEWPDDARLRLVSAADVSSVFHSSEAVQQGLLLDLGPLMEADPNFDADDFHPGLLEYFQSDGGSWAVPTEASYQLILFNKDAFDEAGVEYVEPGWSWDDFLATAQALTLREGDEVVQWGFVEVSPNPAFFVEARTGPLFDPNTDPPTSHLDEPEVADMMRWYADLYLAHEVAPFYPRPDEEEGGFNIPEGYTVIEEGRAAMWPEASAVWPYRSEQMNLGVVPFPVDAPDSATSPVLPSGLSISAGTAQPDAAWRWIDFLSRQTSELGIGFGDPSSLPARRSSAEASGFWDNVDEELGTALRYAADHAFISALPSAGNEALYDALEAIMAEEKTVEEALVDAQIQVEEGQAKATPVPEEIIVAQPDDEELASEDAVTIEFVAGAGPFDMQSFRDLSKAFLETNPDVVVEIKSPDFFGGTPTLSDIAAASDCFQWFPGNFNDPETLAAILSVDPFLDADPDVDKDDFYPIVFDAFTAQGQTWGLPGQVNVTLIEYNKELFDAAGLDYPTADWTTEEFLTLAVTLTQGEEETKQYGYVSDVFEPADLLNFLDRLGVNLIDDSADPPALAFNDPQMIEAVRWYTGLTTEHAVKPVLMTSITGAAVTAIQERQALLDEGRAGMWVNSAIGLELGGESEDEYETGAVPLPAGAGDARGGGFQNASGYFISADTEAREACWRWISFLTEQPNLGSGLPARRAVAESDAYRQHVGPELANAYLASIESATQVPFAQQISEENSWMGYPIFWLYGAYDQILNGELSVDEALDNAQQLAEEYQACVIATEALSDDDGQQACMKETDDSLPDFLFASDE